ncbi:MAG: hypothetical protein COT73_06915 [Bdellovibrio sp. CG10_big_fil_rev_8_21_14_0_10_47_8]|nr:MAG: hypothetical protein COT73_06915 [Bdellovibrio sp. CG10_big_fil_rev_8_21_14_0_10_47_8]
MRFCLFFSSVLIFSLGSIAWASGACSILNIGQGKMSAVAFNYQSSDDSLVVYGPHRLTLSKGQYELAVEPERLVLNASYLTKDQKLMPFSMDIQPSPTGLMPTPQEYKQRATQRCDDLLPDQLSRKFCLALIDTDSYAQVKDQYLPVTIKTIKAGVEKTDEEAALKSCWE